MPKKTKKAKRLADLRRYSPSREITYVLAPTHTSHKAVMAQTTLPQLGALKQDLTKTIFLGAAITGIEFVLYGMLSR